MDIFSFKGMIFELCQYWERKHPSDEIILLWHKEVDYVPMKAIEWLKKQLKRQNEKFPPNISNKIQDLFNEYSKINPEQEGQKQWCEECGGTGWLTVRRYVGSLPYTYSFVCGVCNQVVSYVIPKTTLAVLRQKGFEEYLPKFTRNQVMSEKEKEGLKKLFGVIRRPATDRNEQENPKAIKEIIGDEIPF